MPEPREVPVVDYDDFTSLEEVEVIVEPEETEAEEAPEKPEIAPVPKGHGGSFVKRGGQLYPRGS